MSLRRHAEAVTAADVTLAVPLAGYGSGSALARVTGGEAAAG
jgi:hypothetical protein